MWTINRLLNQPFCAADDRFANKKQNDPVRAPILAVVTEPCGHLLTCSLTLRLGLAEVNIGLPMSVGAEPITHEKESSSYNADSVTEPIVGCVYAIGPCPSEHEAQGPRDFGHSLRRSDETSSIGTTFMLNRNSGSQRLPVSTRP